VNYLGCGRYYLVSGRDEGYFIVSRLSDIYEKIIPLFDKYPLVGSKLQDGGAPQARPQKIPPCGINLNAAHKIPPAPTLHYCRGGQEGGIFLRGLMGHPSQPIKFPPA
jgi:hypothetical protein